MKLPAFFFFLVGALFGQVPNPTQSKAAPPRLFRALRKPSTTTTATGTSHVDFPGTALMPAARGQAGVENRLGSTKIETHVDHMTPASQFGSEYMTYVLWALCGLHVEFWEVGIYPDV